MVVCIERKKWQQAMALYQADLQRGRVSLGNREVIDVQQALQLGWRPRTPEEEEDSDEPEYQEVDLTQEWSGLEQPLGRIRNILSKTIELIGVVPTMGKTRGERMGEVLAVLSTSQGAEKGREAPVVKIFSEKWSWAELEGLPISEVHNTIMKKLKGTPEAL
jgi:hypothetical protein